MPDLNIAYRLPVSALRFAGTRTETEDTILGHKDIARSGTVELDVVGGEQELVLRVDGGFLSDAKTSFSKTEDGRLTGLDVTTTGQGGKVLLGVASLAANVAGLFLGLPPSVLGAVDGGDPSSDQAKVTQAYVDAGHGDLADVRKQYEELVAGAVKDIANKSERLRGSVAGAERAGLLNDLRMLQQLLPFWRAELDRLLAHFAAWRAGTIVKRSTQHADVLSLDLLRDAGVTLSADGTVKFDDDDSGGRAKAIWDRIGLLVTMPRVDVSGFPKPSETNSVVVREPRITVLSVYERQADDTARLQRTLRVLVVDSACGHQTVRFDKSWFSKREAKLTFSSLGTLTGIAAEAESSAASLAGTLGELGPKVQAGLETAQKTRTAWVGLREAGAAEELARVKREAELKQKQLELSGLSATDSQYAELERLKQEAEILAKRKAIGDAALDDGAREVLLLKQQVETLKGQKDLSEATRTLQAERELYDLRLEIERLKAEKEASGKP